MKIGNPIEPMLVAESGASDGKFADVLKKHGGKTFAEVKYDGYRAQVHKSDRLYLFSKSLIELDISLFPDIQRQLSKHPRGIFDGELVGFGSSHLEEFQAVQRRMGSETNADLLKKYPLQIRFFDVMQLGDKPLVNMPLYDRRAILKKNVENISEQEIVDDAQRLKAKFEGAVEGNLEGLVCKDPQSEYIPGSKGKEWVKLKKFLTLDFVVLGIYLGEGKSAELPFAAVLLGTRNGNDYETISKVGLMNREMVNLLYGKIKAGLTTSRPEKVRFSEELKKKSYATKIPFRYVIPEQSAVVEVKTLNITRSDNWHTCGLKDGKAYSLRIASVERIRADKRIKDANTTQQITEIYQDSI